VQACVALVVLVVDVAGAPQQLLCQHAHTLVAVAAVLVVDVAGTPQQLLCQHEHTLVAVASSRRAAAAPVPACRHISARTPTH
jgi:hypothetical protein